MLYDSTDDRWATPSVRVSGGAYRGVVTGDRVPWLCPHVHFTSESARSCADRRVTKLAKASLAGRTAT
jgi:hypothetical protein